LPGKPDLVFPSRHEVIFSTDVFGTVTPIPIANWRG
jgi:hypothetical protein